MTDITHQVPGPGVFRLCLFMLAFMIPPTAGYASPQPPEAENVHFCLPLDFEETRALDSIYAASKQALNLNVGRPRTVRMIYFLPNDRPFRASVVDSMKRTIRQIQTFYREQMQAHGYGNTTFGIETDALGEPMIHRLDGIHSDSYYLDNTSRTVLDEVERVFDRDANVYLVVIDNSTNKIGIDGGESVAGVGGNLGKVGGYGLVHGAFLFKTAAHELGHAFGLKHNFKHYAYIMSYGREGLYTAREKQRLSACNGEFLAVHPYFNPDVEAREVRPPSITLISPTSYSLSSRSVQLRFRVSDSDGLHQIILLVKTKEPHPAAGFLEVKACRGLRGETSNIVEFEYDGVIPSDWRMTTLNRDVHPITIYAVDAEGNVKHNDVTLTWTRQPPAELLIAALKGHRSVVRSVAFAPNGNTLASASGDSTIKLWEVATHRNFDTIGLTYQVNSLAFAPNGKTLAVGSNSNAVNLLDLTSKQWNVTTLGSLRSSVTSVAFTPDGSTLAASSFGQVRLWDVATGANIANLSHTNFVESVAFSLGGETLAFSIGVGLWG